MFLYRIKFFIYFLLIFNYAYSMSCDINSNLILDDFKLEIDSDYIEIKKLKESDEKSICSQGLINTENKLFLNLDSICSITNTTFREKMVNDPVFVLALVKCKNNSYFFYDGSTLNDYYNSPGYVLSKEQDKKSLICINNNEPIKKIYYYFFNPINKNFVYIGNNKNLWGTSPTESLNAKKINLIWHLQANDKPSFRLLLGLYYNFKNNLNLAYYFYQKSEDSPLKFYMLTHFLIGLYFYALLENFSIDMSILEKKIQYYSDKAFKEENFKTLTEFAILLANKCRGQWAPLGNEIGSLAIQLLTDLDSKGCNNNDILKIVKQAVGDYTKTKTARRRLIFEK